MAFAIRTEKLFGQTIDKHPAPPLSGDDGTQGAPHGSLTAMALQLLEPAAREACLSSISAEPETPEWVAEILSWSRGSAPFADALPVTAKKAIEVDCAIRSVAADPALPELLPPERLTGLFRAGGALLDDEALLDLKPSRMPGVQVLEFDVVLGPFMAARRPKELPASPEPGKDYLLVVPAGRDKNAVIRLEPPMALFLQQCSGHKSAREIMAGFGEPVGLETAMVADRLMTLLVEGALTYS